MDTRSEALDRRSRLGSTATSRSQHRPISPTFVTAVLRLFDCAVVAAVGFGIYLYYIPADEAGASSRYLGSILAAVVVAAVVFHWSGVYASGVVFQKRARADRVLVAWTITSCVLLAVAFLLKISDDYSRVWALLWFVTTFAVLAVGRLVLSAVIVGLAADGRFANRTVIVGAGPQGQRLAEHLSHCGDAHTRIIGFVDDRKDRVPPECHGFELLGDTMHLIQLIKRGMVDQVFVALPWSAEKRLHGLLRRLATMPVPIRLAPDLVGFDLPDRAFTQVAQLPMLNVLDRPISGYSYLAKTILDRSFASLSLILFAPLMALIAIAIKLDSSGPILFKQKRLGFNHNLIEVWKFRTMYHHLSDADARVLATRSDPRVTRVGRFLRKSSLDELPQLFNVLSGSMSIVGPRPHALSAKAAGRLYEEAVDLYAARHRVKPGITGWAQVNGWRGETDTVEKIQKRVECDLYYIDNWSLWLDLRIMLKTIVILFVDKNAY